MLNTQKIARLKPRDKRYTLTDSHGLTLRVHPSGVKSWVLRLCLNGKVKDVTLGHFPELDLRHARQLAREKRKEFNLTAPLGYTLKDAFKLWVDLKRGQIVSYRDERRMLERYLIKPLANVQIDEITAPLILRITEQLEKLGKRTTRKRVISRAREILDLATFAGYLQHNPITGLNGILPKPTVKPMPSVDWRTLPDVMKTFTNATPSTKRLFLITLLLMVRPNEAASLRWSWIDNEILTIPPEQMKKRRQHRVPLSSFALQVLDICKASSKKPRSDFVFPGRNGHISSQTLAKFLHKTEFRDRLVGHGLRSMARSWLADNGAPYEVAEECLAHVTGSQVSRAYQRSDFLDNRKVWLDLWSDYVKDCASCAGLI